MKCTAPITTTILIEEGCLSLMAKSYTTKPYAHTSSSITVALKETTVDIAIPLMNTTTTLITQCLSNTHRHNHRLYPHQLRHNRTK